MGFVVLRSHAWFELLRLFLDSFSLFSFLFRLRSRFRAHWRVEAQLVFNRVRTSVSEFVCRGLNH